MAVKTIPQDSAACARSAGSHFEQGAFRLLVGRHAADDFQVLEIELR
ncbi:hypothetical protein JOE40_002327 [Arthrobacter sp. PvP102]|nr:MULTISPECIES: hypothetical protein [unclassified Arthrobacter]MBP1232683.1 hypothetical protein [Arthrobacter sp. PvP103]MBP1237818.1 hypothetical protein [Arthrobacter sp. PvP102]